MVKKAFHRSILCGFHPLGWRQLDGGEFRVVIHNHSFLGLMYVSLDRNAASKEPTLLEWFIISCTSRHRFDLEVKLGLSLWLLGHESLGAKNAALQELIIFVLLEEPMFRSVFR